LIKIKLINNTNKRIKISITYHPVDVFHKELDPGQGISEEEMPEDFACIFLE